MGIQWTAGKAMALVAFTTALGLTLLLLSCALDKNWWPLMELIPFFALPFIGILMAGENQEPANFTLNLAYFLAGVMGVSLFAIPAVQLHLAAITSQALWLAISGNIVIFGGVIAYTKIVQNSDYSSGI